MKILLLGFGYIAQHLLNDKDDFVAIDIQKKDIPIKFYYQDACDYNALEKIIKTEKPDVVIDSAANKYIDECEQNISSSICDNLIITQNIVDLKDIYNFKLVYLSTDKAVSPTSVYGAEKLISERLVLKHNGVVIRLVNVMYSTGSVLPIWEELKQQNKPLIVNGRHTNRYMMTMEDLRDVIFKSFDYQGQIIIPKKIKKINIYQLAKSISKNITVKKLKKFEKCSEQLKWKNENIIRL